MKGRGDGCSTGIDLSISKGDYLLLCGGSGSGKTTLAYLLNGLVPHFFEGTLEGSVIVEGRDTKGCTVSDMITAWVSSFKMPRPSSSTVPWKTRSLSAWKVSV